MSVLQYVSQGGMAIIGGDLAESERRIVNDALKAFAANVQRLAQTLQLPAAKLTIRQANFLFVGKTVDKYHIVLATTPGQNQLQYRDFTGQGRIELSAIVHQVRIEVGEVAWAFSLPSLLAPPAIEELMAQAVSDYLNAVMEAQRAPGKKLGADAVAHPEIASGMEKFRVDHAGKRTAFIMMRFSDTDAHNSIATAVKDALRKKGIVGLRADDKEYMSELFPNIRVYMHACDFGIGIFERITEDDFNPNLSLEVGYMLGLGKDVLLLKDKTLKELQSDLVGRLYRPFDTRKVEASVPAAVTKWLADKGLGKRGAG